MDTPKFIQITGGSTGSAPHLYGLTVGGQVYEWDRYREAWVLLVNKEGYR